MAEDDSASAGASSGERADSADSFKLRRPPIRTLSGERLRRMQRLRSPHDFQRVRAQGRRVSGALLLLGYAAQAESEPAGATRVGFSVSRRVGNAVRRNRVKRRLREVVRRMLAGVAPGYDLVVTARPGAADARTETLEREMRALLARARLLIPTTPSGTMRETDQDTDQDTDQKTDRGTAL